MNEAHKQLLRDKFNDVVNQYAEAFCRQLDINPKDGFWVFEDVGGVYCFLDGCSISLLDMVYVVEKNISLNELLEWYDYNIFAHRFNFNHINLKSWHMGCPRASKEEIDKIECLEQQFIKACDDLKKRNDGNQKMA